MFDKYVSLGRDCEVGFQIKRVLGCQESGFFNWNYTEYNSLVSILKSDFSNILMEENISLHGDGSLILDSSHDFFLHHDFCVELFRSSPSFSQVLNDLREKFLYFSESFRNNAKSERKTAYFLKYTMLDAHSAAKELYDLLMLYHGRDNFILIVLQTYDNEEPSWELHGVYNRYLKRFAPIDDTLDAHVPSWDNIFQEFPHKKPLRLATY